MHALLITFRSAIPVHDLAEPFEDYARALQDQPGLLNKTWVQDGDTLGGFHLFATRGDLDAYMQSDLAAGLMATDGFSDFSSRTFEVLAGLSAMTGVSAEGMSCTG